MGEDVRRERFLPTGCHSLSSDAPGWMFQGTNSSKNLTNGVQTQLDDSLTQNDASHTSFAVAQHPKCGPTCWKCKGRGWIQKKQKFTEGNTNKTKECNHFVQHLDDPTRTLQIPSPSCPVCHGLGYLPPKAKEAYARDHANDGRPGLITWKRRYPPGWEDSGPIAYAVLQMYDLVRLSDHSSHSNLPYNHHPIWNLLHTANHRLENYESSDSKGVQVPQFQYDSYEDSIPPWIPGYGEELCNLVGTWRILQCVGSHRWTTDDLMTAFVAQSLAHAQFPSKHPSQGPREDLPPTNVPKKSLRYLDLGTGNGSVLQMVLWSLMEQFHVEAYGIEARTEAVQLARRSLMFNVGPTHVGEQTETPTRVDPNSTCQVSILHGDFRDLSPENKTQNDGHFQNVTSQTFDLITGTPPYFRVDFEWSSTTTSNSSKTDPGSMTKAVIQQGGMPTSMQSAPARCEFRGGIEEYCKAASSVLDKDGIFVVCENWLNFDRVYHGAKAANLTIREIFPVKGKEDKAEILFGVFVLQTMKEPKNQCYQVNMKEAMVVRNIDGKWTNAYAEVLESMSIPALHCSV